MSTEILIIFRCKGPASMLMVKNDITFEKFKMELRAFDVPAEFINANMVAKTDQHDACALSGDRQWQMLMFLVRSSGCQVVTITSDKFCEEQVRVTNSSNVAAIEIPTQPQLLLEPQPTRAVCVISSAPDEANVPHINLPISEKKDLLTAPWGNYIQGVGQVFKGGVTQFRMKLSKYMLEKGYKFNYVRNTDKQVLARCAQFETYSCKWYINATYTKFNNWFTIRSFIPEHRCPMDVRSNKRLSASLIGALIVDKVKNDPNITANEIIDLFHGEYGLNIEYKQAYRGILKAQDFIYGCHDDSYHELKWYMHNLKKQNMGSLIVFLEGLVADKVTGEKKNRFLKTFVAFGATILGFEHCRPMLFIDGTHLSGRYGGVILSATAKDVDNGLFPVAFAIVDSETKENWRWFLLNLLTTFSAGRKIIFVSDRHIGLMQLFEQEFKDYENFYCLQHLKRNLRDKLKKRALNPKEKDKVVNLFGEAARSPTKKIFDETIADLKIAGGASVAAFLDGLPPNKWAFAFAPCARFGEMTSNAAESYNNWIKDARELPITQCVDAIRIQTMEQLYRRRTAAESLSTGLCAGKKKEPNAAIQEARSWNVRRATKYVFEFLLAPTLVVKLDERKCDCFGWQFHGYPCAHGIAAIHLSGLDMHLFIDIYYFDEAYKQTYQGCIMPVSTITKLTEMGDEWEKVFPPVKSRLPGRPRKNRYLSIDEHVGNKKRKYRCTRCKGYGHPAKKCKNPIA